MKLVVYEAESWECPRFNQLRDQGYEVVCTEERLTAESVNDHPDAEVVSTFIYSRVTPEVIDALPGLKLVTTRSTGFDHVDIAYCADKGIPVCNVPDYGQNTVAEHVFALLLTVSHNMYQAIDRTRRGEFSQRGLQGFDLWGKTLGVVGAGDIGQCAIRIAKGFGMEVLAFDAYPDETAAQELGFRYVDDLSELLANSDVVTLHVPGSEKTKHMIGKEQFDLMKDGSVLINTARGNVVETRALVRALAEGKLAGAGLDVLPEEPVIREEAELLRSVYEEWHNTEDILADHVLLRLRNVVVTPHTAFATKEAVDRILEVTVANVTGYQQGEPQNVVNDLTEAAKR